MASLDSGSNLATSLFKALDLLTLVASRSGGWPIARLVEQMELPRSSVIRMLDSLIHYGLVERDDARSYRATQKFRDWRMEDPDEGLRLQFLPLMRRLTEELGEMTVLGCLRGRRIAHLHHVEPDRRVRVAPPAGRRFETRRLAMGKLAMSCRPDWLPGDLSASERSELDEVRQSGYAWNRGESEPDIVAWATWLGKPSSMTPMIAITWPTFRFSEAAWLRARELLRLELEKLPLP
jgi:DNA-binding IclR family transcriptional regulator